MKNLYEIRTSRHNFRILSNNLQEAEEQAIEIIKVNDHNPNFCGKNMIVHQIENDTNSKIFQEAYYNEFLAFLNNIAGEKLEVIVFEINYLVVNIKVLGSELGTLRLFKNYSTLTTRDGIDQGKSPVTGQFYFQLQFVEKEENFK